MENASRTTRNQVNHQFYSTNNSGPYTRYHNKVKAKMSPKSMPAPTEGRNNSTIPTYQHHQYQHITEHQHKTKTTSAPMLPLQEQYQHKNDRNDTISGVSHLQLLLINFLLTNQTTIYFSQMVTLKNNSVLPSHVHSTGMNFNKTITAKQSQGSTTTFVVQKLRKL